MQGAFCSSVWLRAIANPKPRREGSATCAPALPERAHGLVPVTHGAVALLRGSVAQPHGSILPQAKEHVLLQRCSDPQIHPSLRRFTAERICFLPGYGPVPHFSPPAAPISHSGPFLRALTHPQTFNLVSNKISQPHYSSQAHHLHLNEWAINKVNFLRHCIA